MGKLYIGNLSFETTTRDLEKKFEKFGKIVKANIAYDSDKKSSKGFGFVIYEHDQDAKDAKSKLNGSDLRGRRIMVDWAKDSGAERDNLPNKGRRNDSNGNLRRKLSVSRSPEKNRERDRSERDRSVSRSPERKQDPSIPRKRPPDRDRDPPKERDRTPEPPRDRSRSREERRDADRGRRDRSPDPRGRDPSPDRGRDPSPDRDRGRDRSPDRGKDDSRDRDRDRRRDQSPERSPERSRDGRREPERRSTSRRDEPKRGENTTLAVRNDDRVKRNEDHERALAEIAKLTTEANELRDDRRQLTKAVQKYLDAKLHAEEAEQDLKILLGKLEDF